MVETHQEREAKYELAEGVELPDFDGVDDGVRASPRPPLDLTAQYFDTTGLRLLRLGITLRHRREAGDGDAESGEGRWTLKLPDRAGKAVFTRTEMSWGGPPGPLPTEAARLVKGVALGETLVPVAEIHTLRRRISLAYEGGSPLAEVDDDTVTITAQGGGVVGFREIEVELTGGDEQLLDQAGARLEAAGARRDSDAPKLARALLPEKAPAEHSNTAGGTNSDRGDHANRADRANRADHGEQADRADHADQADHADRRLAQQAVIRGLEQLLRQDIGLRLDDDPEFVHQARVATRRMRADLATFGASVDPEWTRQTRAELRWLAATLGHVRDADVLGERLDDHARHAGAELAASFTDLEAVLAGEREEAAADLQDALAGPRYLALLRHLEDAALHAPPVATEADGIAEESLEAVTGLVNRRWDRFRTRVERLGPDPSNDELHSLRIQAKKVRYAADAAVPLAGEGAKRFSKDIADLQSTLGDHHDSAVAAQWCRRVEGSGPVSAAAAARHCVADEREYQAAKRREWEDEWRRVADSHPHAW